MELTPDEAYRRAAARCARQEHCRGEMLRKFAEQGLSPRDAASVADKLEAEGYICDARYAKAFVHDKFLYDRWGKIKIRQSLRLKGVDENNISDALESIGDEEYLEALRAALQQKERSLKAENDYQRRQKLARFAASRGFEPSLIFRLLDLED